MEENFVEKEIKVCGCFWFNAFEKSSLFKACENCVHAQPTKIGSICGFTKYIKGGNNVQKEEEPSNF